MTPFYQALHRLWRCLPRERRQALFYRLTGWLAPRPDPALYRPGPMAVAGLLTTTTGLGKGARLCLEAMAGLGYDTRAADLSPAFNQSDMPSPPVLPPPPGAGEGGTLIVHINGPYLPFALWRLGRAAVAGRKVIGYWAWELPRLPASWRRGLPFVHELWVPSRFTADAVAALAVGSGVPVRVVPHPLPLPRPAGLTRAALGLPDDAFVAMAFFHMGSSFRRKNPLAAVAAFRRAFGDDPEAVLLVKVVDLDLAPWARRELEQAVAGAANIRLVERRLTDPEVDALLALADTVLSLHRAEGFGLVPAQAMLLGKPVVATGWSGNLDFMTPETALLVEHRPVPAADPQGTYDVAGQFWADPDIDHAAACLRRLAADRAFAHALGARARDHALRAFSLETYQKAAGLS